MKLFSLGDDDPLPEYKIRHEKIVELIMLSHR